jgi:lysophospholipase L1-like esterase
VLVEYEELSYNYTTKFIDNGSTVSARQQKYNIKNILKINPKDNTITIKKLKESWNREELPIAILKRIISFGEASPELMNTPFIEIYDKSKKWIKENL